MSWFIFKCLHIFYIFTCTQEYQLTLANVSFSFHLAKLWWLSDETFRLLLDPGFQKWGGFWKVYILFWETVIVKGLKCHVRQLNDNTVILTSINSYFIVLSHRCVCSSFRYGVSEFKPDLRHMPGAVPDSCNNPLRTHLLSNVHHYPLGHKEQVWYWTSMSHVQWEVHKQAHSQA